MLHDRVIRDEGPTRGVALKVLDHVLVRREGIDDQRFRAVGVRILKNILRIYAIAPNERNDKSYPRCEETIN